MLFLASALLLMAASILGTMAQGGMVYPCWQHTITSMTNLPGYDAGCRYQCSDAAFGDIAVYYLDTGDNNWDITSLTLEAGDGVNEASYSSVSFSVTWFYRFYNGYAYTTDWIPYSGTGNIDLLWSGKSSVSELPSPPTGIPRTMLLVRFHITGEVDECFYYRIRFTTNQGTEGNAYFWYRVCSEHFPRVPEFHLELPAVTMLGAVAIYMVHRRKLGCAGKSC